MMDDTKVMIAFFIVAGIVASIIGVGVTIYSVRELDAQVETGKACIAAHREWTMKNGVYQCAGEER